MQKISFSFGNAVVHFSRQMGFTACDKMFGEQDVEAD